MSLALIFDLDGTLVDTAPDLLAATNAVLEAAGRPAMDTTTLRHMVGFGAKSLIAQAMAASGTPADEAEMDRLVGIFLEHYRAHLADFSRPFPGVVETLARLKGEGARLGILTNKPAELTGPLLEQLDMARFFTAVYGAGRKSYTKPDPRIFHDVVTDLFNDPPLPSPAPEPATASPPSGRFAPKGEAGQRHAIMIGDSITDLSTARAAGAPCILMSYGYTPMPARELGADLVLDDFRQLPDALKNLKFQDP